MVMDVKQKSAGTSIYVPEIATITNIQKMSETEKLFDIKIDDDRARKGFDFLPGQFIELTVFGLGEAPFSIPSSPNKNLRGSGGATRYIPSPADSNFSFNFTSPSKSG